MVEKDILHARLLNAKIGQFNSGDAESRFEQLVSPFEAAFQAHMALWRLNGKPRTTRQFAVYKTCPLPTPQDRLCPTFYT